MEYPPGRERFIRARQAKEEAEKASKDANEASFVPPELKPLEKMMKEVPLGLKPGISIIVIKTESDQAEKWSELARDAGSVETGQVSIDVTDVLYKYIGKAE